MEAMAHFFARAAFLSMEAASFMRGPAIKRFLIRVPSAENKMRSRELMISSALSGGSTDDLFLDKTMMRSSRGPSAFSSLAFIDIG